ncbi:MAG: hypothetical protein JO294_01900 [Alphaproteobacteria bacterium]|nr:hypothetical protein [Alphaproteobacteria bacterium]MBV9903233.1 hypothetical protein [Alphaproteobacteria bacterium]
MATVMPNGIRIPVTLVTDDFRKKPFSKILRELDAMRQNLPCWAKPAGQDRQFLPGRSKKSGVSAALFHNSPSRRANPFAQKDRCRIFLA